ncbi:MAG: hypothetical protein ACR2QU_02420, partial [Gammaproteobacteria bacterium]
MSDKSPPQDTIRANTDLGDMVRRGKTPPSRINLNPVVTKTAVDLLNLTEETADEIVTNALKGIREISKADSVCIAQFAADPENPGAPQISKLSHSTSVLAGCSPEGLLGQSLDQLSWLAARLDHMRLLEITDSRSPVEENREECDLLAGLGIGAALIGGFSVEDEKIGFLAIFSASPVESWDVDFYLLMKLIGASLASGFARLRLQQDLGDIRERDN